MLFAKATVLIQKKQKRPDKKKYFFIISPNKKGRINELYPQKKLFEKGVYEVIFHTGPFYKKAAKRTFFPYIPVVFTIKNTAQSYHIPLLLSPYGYSTYRGN